MAESTPGAVEKEDERVAEGEEEEECVSRGRPASSKGT